jgi:hypothetical protein
MALVNRARRPLSKSSIGSSNGPSVEKFLAVSWCTEKTVRRQKGEKNRKCTPKKKLVGETVFVCWKSKYEVGKSIGGLVDVKAKNQAPNMPQLGLHNVILSWWGPIGRGMVVNGARFRPHWAPFVPKTKQWSVGE